MKLADADIDLDTGELTRGGAAVSLLPSERALLAYLVANPERTLSREELLTAVWGYAPGTRTRTVDTTVKTLRAKLEPDPSNPTHLRTVRGTGYCFVAGAAPAPTHALPTPPDLFVGREAERRALGRSADRLVTLTGPGGIGKTRLALEVARTSGRAWFCDLTGVVAEDAAAAEVARALEVPLPTRGDRVGVVGAALAARGRATVVLDNAEDLDESAVAAIGRWVDGAPAIDWRITSRRPLRLRGEVRFEVPPLAPADAVALLTDRGRRVRAGFGADAEAAWLEAIVEAVDGIPLALELAAAHAAVLGAEAIAARIRGSLAWLDRGAADAPERHHTLRATLAWTWDQLEPAQRAALSHCAVFAAPFRAEDAEQVVQVDGRALDRVHELRDWSLLSERVDPLGEVRLRLLEVVRAFVREVAPPDPAAARRHATWAVAQGEAFERAADRRGGEQALARLGAMQPDLLQVVETGTPDEVVRCAIVVDRVLAHEGRAAERRRVTDRAVEVARSDPARADAHRLRAEFRAVTGEDPEDEVEAALEAAKRAADPRVDARVWASITRVRLHQGRFADAGPPLRQALALHRADGDRVAEADRLANLGLVLAHTDRADEALSVFDSALAMHREVGNRTGEGKVLGFLGAVYLDRGEHDRAERCFTRALASHQEIGYAPGVLRMQGNLAVVDAHRGRFASAAGRYRELVARAAWAGDRVVERIARTYLSRMTLYLGRVDDALEEATLAVEGYRSGGSALFEALARAALGLALWRGGRPAQARATFDAAVVGCTQPRMGGLLRCERAMLAWEQGDAATFAEDRAEAAALLVGDPPGQQMLAVVDAWVAPDRAAARALIGPPLSDLVHWWLSQLDRR